MGCIYAQEDGDNTMTIRLQRIGIDIAATIEDAIAIVCIACLKIQSVGEFTAISTLSIFGLYQIGVASAKIELVRWVQTFQFLFLNQFPSLLLLQMFPYGSVQRVLPVRLQYGIRLQQDISMHHVLGTAQPVRLVMVGKEQTVGTEAARLLLHRDE